MKEQIITINIQGETESDLDLAIDEAVSKIKQGFTFGMDSNESGGYDFKVEEN